MSFVKDFLSSKSVLLATVSAAAILLARKKLESHDNGRRQTTDFRLECELEELEEKIDRARQAVQRHMAIVGTPGMSIGVARDGQTVWLDGFGFADVESGALCSAHSVMRIASISKPMTATIAARLMERSKLDLDKPIHDYISTEQFPRKFINGRVVEITARQLLSHTSGVRHYPKKDEADPDSTDYIEFTSNKHFNSVSEALSMFRDDPLLCEPGSEYHYTTHGYTLLSAVLERADGGERKFSEMLSELFARLHMRNTHLDSANEQLVPNRTRYYLRNGKTHKLENVGEVDCSNKIAGGGVLSNVGDLLKFANAILYSYQFVPMDEAPQPLLHPSTVRELWRRHANAIVGGQRRCRYGYGLGWQMPKENCWAMQEWSEKENCKNEFRIREYWYHLGGAVGASSVLLIKPNKRGNSETPPQGICVAILANCQNCPCLRLAEEIADIFDDYQ